MQAPTYLPSIKFLLDPTDEFLVESYKEITPTDYISVHSNRSSTSSPLSTTPPITPMSSSGFQQQKEMNGNGSAFRLPSISGTASISQASSSYQNKPSLTLNGLPTGHNPHPSNILSLLSPPESPDMASSPHQSSSSSPSFDVYGRSQQQEQRYDQPQFNTYPAYTSTVKPAPVYASPVSRNPQSSTSGHFPYHTQPQHHTYQSQPIHPVQTQRYIPPLALPYDRRTVPSQSLPRLDMSHQMLGNGNKRIGSSKSLEDQSSNSSSSSSNSNRYQCPYCSKRFSRPSSLRIHTYSHTGEKPFACTELGCGRKFSVQSNMRRHLRVHRLGRPVKKVRYDGEVEGVKVMNPGSVLRTC